MRRFAEWLLAEERSLVDPGVLNSYEKAFQQRLEDLIQRTKAPDLRRALEDMRQCPIKSMDVGRHTIIQTIERYAQATQNWHMLRLLDRFRERYPNRFAPPQSPKRKPAVTLSA